jgi:hypothetical protein
VAQLRDYGKAAQLARSPARTAALIAHGGLPTPEPAESSSVEDGVRERLELLRLRVGVIRELMETGAPITSEEVRLLLGARPGSSEVVRGRVVAVREGRDCWSLEPLAVEEPG